MTNDTLAKLNSVFTESFIHENENVSDLVMLYKKVVAIDPTIEKNDFDEYVSLLAKEMNPVDGEMKEDELDLVSGGISWEAVGGVCTLVTLFYKAGKALGEAIKNSRK